jgi:nicotinate-nucleotide--dimethylbenzimidazole phosphoribosyltransferase
MTQPVTSLPFDDIRALLRGLPGPDLEAVARVQARERELTKPAGSLGRLEEVTEWLAAWSGKAPPIVTRPVVAIFAAAHGVAARDVSAYPSTVNRQMLENFAAGGAAINQICALNDIGLKVLDLAVDLPTPDITVEPALTEKDCAATIAFGMEAVAGGADLLCVGEMGIGNTTVAAAIYAALFGGAASDWVGPGTGVDAAGLERKRAAVEAALLTHRGHLDDPLQVLRRVGGREIAAITGAIIAARSERVPVLLDGYVTTAAAAVLHAIDPDSIAHCMASHRSAEPAHGKVLERIGLEPLLDLGLRLGEGSGAALAVGLVKAAAATHAGMATFAQAGVSGKQG